ncbi:MAG: hypothetical protein H5T69_10415 [Chloroflexi bacterium]|nr:hypothetical protein [Chloroflexota bacterium]
MDYGRIIKRAIEITLRHRVLWIFGIAVALFGGVSGKQGGGQGLQYAFSGQDWQRFFRQGPGVPARPFSPFGPVVPWETILPMVFGLLALLFVLGLAWIVVGILVRYTSLGALIGMVNEIEEREETSFRAGLRIGWGRLLHLFVMNLIIGIAVFILVLVLILILILGGLLAAVPAILLFRVGEGAGIVGILIGVAVGLVLILVLVLLGLALSAAATLVREYAFRASVLDQRGIFEALGAGLGLMRSRLRESLLIWLFLAVIRLALGIVAIPLVLIGIGIVLGPALAAYGLSESFGLAALSAVPGLLLLLLAGAFLGGLWATFYSAAWTLTFRELRAGQTSLEAA